MNKPSWAMTNRTGLKPSLLSLPFAGPVAVMLLIGARRWFATGSLELALADIPWLVLALFAWLRWAAAREYTHLETLIERMSSQLDRLDAK